MQNTVCYEQPLNERIRMLLRLEFLFDQINYAVSGTSPWDTRLALQGLFEIFNLTARNELRSELLKELDRHATTLNRLRQSRGVNTQALDTILEEIDDVVSQIHGLDTLVVEEVRQNEFLNAIRQRSSIPGGTCRFDLPALHHWLQHHSTERTIYLQGWLRPFLPMQASVRLILRLVRTSDIPDAEVAVGGFYQKALDSSAPSQMVRVFLPIESAFFPEISGGKHRFSIRFMQQSDPNQRASQTTEDISFQLACCII